VDPPVAYECTAPAHQRGEAGPDKLTVHEGAWAFCPYGARSEGHEWKATGGVPLAMLRLAAAARQKEQVKSGVK